MVQGLQHLSSWYKPYQQYPIAGLEGSDRDSGYVPCGECNHQAHKSEQLSEMSCLFLESPHPSFWPGTGVHNSHVSCKCDATHSHRLRFPQSEGQRTCTARSYRGSEMWRVALLHT